MAARRDRRLYEMSNASPQEWPDRPHPAPKSSGAHAIRTRNSLTAGTQRKNLIGKFTVKLFDGERFDVLVHRQGHQIMLNDSRVDPVNQIHQLGWEREIRLKVPNVVDLDYRPFGRQPLIWE